MRNDLIKSAQRTLKPVMGETHKMCSAISDASHLGLHGYSLSGGDTIVTP